jgi:outer membrane protein OmpA-like peptidoglycan-associated protein
MPRLRIAILPLFTALVVPAFGETATSSCQSWNASYCEAEFAQARNAEIDASIAAAKAAREHAFVEARNAEIDASIQAVKMAALQRQRRTSCESPEAGLAPCQGEVAANFARERNAEIELSLAAVKVARERSYAEARNAEIEASILTVKAVRESEFALRRTSCESPEANLPPCEGEVAANFAKARTAEIDASIAAAAVERERRFAQERNAEITASTAAAKAARVRDYAEARTAEMLAWVSAIRGGRAQRFAEARNAEIDASIAAVKAARERDLALSLTNCKTADSETPRCDAERSREFAAARNAEIDAALSAYRAERMIRTAQAQTKAQTQAIDPQSHSAEPSIETGAIRVPEVPVEPILPLRRSIGTEPCPAAGIRLTPVQFSGPGATVDDAMKPGLDTVAAIARDCPGVQIEIHGYSDTTAAIHVSRLLSELRAKAAMAYLESVGVAAARMTAIGHGDMIPLAANTTPENRAQNRRVEFTIKDPALQAGVKRVMWDLSELLDPTYVPQLARLSP